MAEVKCDRITRRFENTVAIRDITFTIPDGEFWVLVGPSGCGKSTILRTIAGLEPVSDGQLYIGDQLVNAVPARQRDVAMVFQNYALYPHMTVAENLAFGLKMRGADDSQIQQQTEQVAQALGIRHLLDRKPKQLSGGQQQRVALGRAIARQPRVFLLDEPLSNLDAQLRDDTRAELKQLHQRYGITTIYVTHDQVEAMTLADQIVVLDRGEIQQIGSPQQVYASPKNQMVATFLGNPPMNLLPATYDGEQFKVGQQVVGCVEKLRSHLQPQQKLTLGIRPEAIKVGSVSDISDQSSPTNHLTVEVTLVEPLGREVLVRAKLPETNGTGYSLNLLTTPDRIPKVGDRLAIALDINQLFLFDPNTGQRIDT
ncbi:MAG: ABC transporter ATP-binding protein [Thainema sp.]